MRRRSLICGGWLLIALIAAAPAAGQTPPTVPTPAPTPTPLPVPTPPPPRPLLRTPKLLARGVTIPFHGSRVEPSARVVIERLRHGAGWHRVTAVRADAAGRFAGRFRPPPSEARIRLRARVHELTSKVVVVHTRSVTLDAVGDVNLGDGPGGLIAASGPAAPWTSVGSTLRRADIALANLECAVSLRGAAQAKQYVFRGRPASLRAAHMAGGLDVVTLANNHAVDFGTLALLDTLGFAHRYGIATVGAGRNASAALRPAIVERLGLKVGFVGLSDINPPAFNAGPASPGTARASATAVAAAVHGARKRGADVVVAYFHWGIERTASPNAQQRALAQAALRAGAQVVLGAHPHVLQPIHRAGHTLIDYSLGNFVFSANSPGTESTGILELRLSTAGVVGSRFRRARIAGSRPILR